MKTSTEQKLILILTVIGIIFFTFQDGKSQSGRQILNTAGMGTSSSQASVFSLGETFVGSVSAQMYGVLGFINPSIKSTTSTKDTHGKTWEVTFYPNPVIDEITVETDLSIKQFGIINAAGQLIFYKENNNEGRINISNLPASTYILMCITDKGENLGLGTFIKL